MTNSSLALESNQKPNKTSTAEKFDESGFADSTNLI